MKLHGNDEHRRPGYPGLRLVRGYMEHREGELVTVPVGTLDSKPDARGLEELEGVIRKGLRTYMEVGKALASIRERRLYREKGHDTFEGYCQDEWGWGRSYVNRQIKAAATVEEMVPIGTTAESEEALPMGNRPATESQARPLAQIEDPQERAEAWQETVEEAKAEEKPVTAKRVEEKVRTRLKSAPPEPPPEREASGDEPTMGEILEQAGLTMDDAPRRSEEEKALYPRWQDIIRVGEPMTEKIADVVPEAKQIGQLEADAESARDRLTKLIIALRRSRLRAVE